MRPRSRDSRSRRISPVAVAAVVLAIFVVLAAGSGYLFNQSENRLLRQHTAEAAAVLQASVGNSQAPLSAAAKLASATDGDPAVFSRILQPLLGTDSTDLYTSVSLFRVGQAEPVAHIGEPTSAPSDGANGVAASVQKAMTTPFVVVDLLGSKPRHLAYAVGDAKPAKWVVYAERRLSDDPNVRRQSNQAFSQLDYAFYLGESRTDNHLLTASTRNLPLHGRHMTQALPFGDQKLLIDMTPIGRLSGDLFANLWWIVAAGGALVAAAFGVLTYRLLERRDAALSLAEDNERLYDEQRQIAETLQLSLLPQHFDAPAGLSVAARYWPAGSANLIGGDFYDAFKVNESRWAVAIGDVCGKGIEAASLTGLARHTLRAASRHATSPTEVLHAVHEALLDHRPPTFCTACFAFVTPGEDGAQHISLSLGGHPQPLLRRRDGTVELIGSRGTLLGMIEPGLTTTEVDMMPGDTLVLYTDGLTDAPAPQAVSVGELSSVLQVAGDQPIEQLADTIRVLKRRRRPLGSGDDTALLILRVGGDVIDLDSQPLESEHAFD